MLTIEEYISKQKRKNKIDEFDISNQSENMSAIIKLVMEYFNNYLDIGTLDEDRIKLIQNVDKIKKEIGDTFTIYTEEIIDFYRNYKIRAHSILKKELERASYSSLFHEDNDYISIVDNVIKSLDSKTLDLSGEKDFLLKLAPLVKDDITPRPSHSDYYFLDSNLIEWVINTFNNYKVNLLQFAYNVASDYFDRYVKYEIDRYYDQSYYVNNYDHRYNRNAFDIDSIYEDNCHRPFIENRKGELEMLIMHEWVFECVHDEDYWSEYVNLCINTGKTKCAIGINRLIASKIGDIPYPDDISSTLSYLELSSDLNDLNPKGDYILRVRTEKKYDSVWRDRSDMESFINELKILFNKNGPPALLELSSPLLGGGFEEDVFFMNYSLLEKKMRGYKDMNIALVNGTNGKKKLPLSFICSVSDILSLSSAIKERKLKLRIAIDFSLFNINKRSGGIDESFVSLHEIRKMIICIHLSNIENRISIMDFKYLTKDYDTSHSYMNKFRYYSNGDFFTELNSLFNDYQDRYFIPENISSDFQLEALVDNMLRSGFSFTNKDDNNE